MFTIMDEIKRRIIKDQEEAYEAIKQSSRSIAGGAFNQSMTNLYSNIPTMSDHLRAIFSSQNTITALAEEYNAWKQNAPEGKHVVATMRTPDGRIMDIETIKANGWQGYIAEGFIEGMCSMIGGHIATLSFFCSYEETKGGRRPVGFKIVAEPVIEPPQEPQSTAPDKETQKP